MTSLFKKTSIGLDIADHTIEVVELKSGKISALGRIKLQPGIVEQGRIKDEKKLVEAIKKVLSSAKPQAIEAKKIIFGLPEAQVYTHVFSLKPNDKEEREDLISREAKASIPLPPTDLLYSYKVLPGKSLKTEILLVAASRKVVEEWRNFFKGLNIEIETFDIEILATFRGLFNKKLKGPICLVDIGAATTNIAIFDKAGLRYSYSLKIAGNKFTQGIAENLKIKPEEAEEKKISLGLSDPNNQVFPVLIKSLESIIKEIDTALKYFKENTNQEVKEIVLVGGSSQLKGLVEYFKTNLELPTRLGKPALTQEGAKLEYLGAVGLALYKDGPNIELTEGKRSEIRDQRLEKKEKSKPKPPTSEPNKKLRNQKIILLAILIIGVLALGAAFWYKSYSKKQREAERQAQIEKTLPVDSEVSTE